MERLLAEHEGEVAAVIMEPLVQGAAGMLVHPPGYLRAVRELCDRHDVLLILDEVATGFGRTGRMFACEHEDVAPDLLCLAKGISGGYLPLAATLASERVYEGFLGEFEEFRTFFHGHTYTGNPLACAAAIATLDVFREERTLERAGSPRSSCWASCSSRSPPTPPCARCAACGFMTGIELAELPLPTRIGHQVTLAARRRGAIIRPLGDVMVLMPPLGDLGGRPAPPGGDHRRGDRRPRRRSRGPSGLAGRTRALRTARVPGAPAARASGASPSRRRARSPSCERRTRGRTSRPGCPRTACRRGSRRRDRPRRGRR